MHKVGRKALAVTGSLFTILCLVAIAGLMWAVLDSHAFYSDAVRQSRCLANLARIDAAKTECGKLHELTTGAPVSAEEITEFIDGGWVSLKCPGGGTYTIGAMGVKAACSVHGRGEEIKP